MLRECVMQQRGLPEWHSWLGHGREAQALAAKHAFTADDNHADQAELSDQMMGEKVERLPVEGQHYDSMGTTCTVWSGVHEVLGCTTLLAVVLCAC